MREMPPFPPDGRLTSLSAPLPSLPGARVTARSTASAPVLPRAARALAAVQQLLLPTARFLRLPIVKSNTCTQMTDPNAPCSVELLLLLLLLSLFMVVDLLFELHRTTGLMVSQAAGA